VGVEIVIGTVMCFCMSVFCAEDVAAFACNLNHTYFLWTGKAYILVFLHKRKLVKYELNVDQKFRLVFEFDQYPLRKNYVSIFLFLE
jgi:hypothetical protein